MLLLLPQAASALCRTQSAAGLEPVSGQSRGINFRLSMAHFQATLLPLWRSLRAPVCLRVPARNQQRGSSKYTHAAQSRHRMPKDTVTCLLFDPAQWGVTNAPNCLTMAGSVRHNACVAGGRWQMAGGTYQADYQQRDDVYMLCKYN